MNMIEIERKFLVNKDAIPFDSLESYDIEQSYLVRSEKGSIRIRIEMKGIVDNKAYLTSKRKMDSMTNDETTTELPMLHARKMINTFCDKVIRKTRYIKYENGDKWEIDIFKEPNNGLVLAEIELKSVDQEVILPNWVIAEVTGNKIYYNQNM